QKKLADVVLDAQELAPERLVSLFCERAVDLGILAWWPRIIADPLLSAPKRGFLNFHPSLLPHNRGKHTTFWNLVEDVPFGVSIHWADAGIDSGPIAFQRPILKTWLDTSESLYRRAQAEMVDLFRTHLADIAADRIPR